MKYVVSWAFCLLALACKTVPAAEYEAEPGGLSEVPPAPLERREPSSLEAAGEEAIPSVNWLAEEPAEQEELPDAEPEFAAAPMADLPKEEDTPEITLFEPFPPDFSLEASDEVTALPEPVFPEPEAGPEIVVMPVPAPPPRDPEPLVMDPPPVLDIPMEPAPEPVRVPPPALVNPPAQSPPPRPAPPSGLVRVSPPAPVNPPAQSPPSRPAPPPEPDAKPRPVEPASGIRREPLPLPTAPIPNLPARDPPSPSEEAVEYSRVVRAVAGQTIEIPFRGTGWVYLGELRSRPGVTYNSRRSDPEGQTFVFRAEEAGTFGLKFYKQDYIRDYILNDYVRVIVDEAPAREVPASSRDLIRVISAPRWPYLPGEEPSAGTTARAGDSLTEDTPTTAVVPQAPAGQRPPVRAAGPDDDGIVPVTPPRAASSAGEQPPPPGDGGPALPDDTLPEEYFRKAREAFEGGQIQPALATLDQFRERYPLGSDEAWWLYGQFLEAAGPSRDIRLALDYYRRLVREYPQSPRCNDARSRIAYLERFYFNIR